MFHSEWLILGSAKRRKCNVHMQTKVMEFSNLKALVNLMSFMKPMRLIVQNGFDLPVVSSCLVGWSTPFTCNI